MVGSGSFIGNPEPTLLSSWWTRGLFDLQGSLRDRAKSDNAAGHCRHMFPPSVSMFRPFLAGGQSGLPFLRHGVAPASLRHGLTACGHAKGATTRGYHRLKSRGRGPGAQIADDGHRLDYRNDSHCRCGLAEQSSRSVHNNGSSWRKPLISVTPRQFATCHS